jgi:cadmium resistance protein CadD (predicted permease)
MHGLAVTLVKAAALFAATNVDGLVVLTTLFMNSATGRPRRWQIITGQYLGFAAMLLLSLLAALGLRVVPDGWVGLIGLLPLAVGVNGLRRACEADTRQVARTRIGLPAIALVILANGADNVSVYTPLFATLSAAMTAVTVAVFLVLVAVWCALAWLLGTNRNLVSTLDHVGTWLVPLVFIAIGAGVLLGTGALGRLLALL